MLKLLSILSFLALTTLSACRLSGQDIPQRLRTGHGALDQKLAKLVTVDEQTISAFEAREIKGAVYLDAREPVEYQVSHLPNALPIGYDDPDFSVLEGVTTDQPLVVYCTVGYRSERLAKKLRKRGFTRVYNLYGSIYSWVLAGLPVEDAAGKTKRVHTYNEKWGSFFPEGVVEKVY